MKFKEIRADEPILSDVEDFYRTLRTALSSGAAQPLDLIREWDEKRKAIGTWSSLVGLHFNQDTRNAEYRAARERRDQMNPKLTEYEVQFKKALLAHPSRPDLEARFGKHIFALWEQSVLLYDPLIEEDLIAEAKYASEYTSLLAEAKLEYSGACYSLSEIVKFRDDPHRQVRHDADLERWKWFASQRAPLDELFGKLTALRGGIAKKLKFNNYVEFGYKEMSRIGYGPAEVAEFRAAVQQYLVPLAQRYREQQAKRLGIDAVMFWDENILDTRPNPRPKGNAAWCAEQTSLMFERMHPDLAKFYQLMKDGEFMDLESREGKAGGGFCTSFPREGLPYIFANFNGSKGDVETLVHELGHAFQMYMSRDKEPQEYVWPSMEACEIHSMGLEFLVWPHMDLFFGDDAPRFRAAHVASSLLFIPYGVTVDHFQHLVYENEAASAADRFRMWQEVERKYLPWRSYGDYPHAADGGFWQFQRHIYLHPFYYVDYCLAQLCALQFHLLAKKNFADALDRYVALCRRGGEVSFLELCASAGLKNPLNPMHVMEIAQAIEPELGLA